MQKFLEILDVLAVVFVAATFVAFVYAETYSTSNWHYISACALVDMSLELIRTLIELIRAILHER